VEIQQVLMNLCTNAAQAMRDGGGTLDITVSDFHASTATTHLDGMEPGHYARLVVRDTGVGITPEIMSKIFDPYFTTKQQGEGTGLGLSVVRGIVTHSHGHITVESEPGKGSTFTVYLPLVSGAAMSSVGADAEDAARGSERILLVDDEEPLAMMGEVLLRELGYEVTSRTSSGEALALFKNSPSRFDLVITDQTMPEMTGVELAKEIRGIRSDIPVILCTGFSYLVDADSSKAAGIKSFAMKPLTKVELARKVREALDG
jgi:CheY-like chemotaxis protein